MEHQTDCELVALARTGHRHAFGQLIERHQQMVKHIVVRMIANDEIARELVQEVMLQAYLSLDHLRDNTRFKSWLYGITLNVCRSHLREQKTNVLSLEALLGGTRGDLTAFLDGLDVVDPQVIRDSLNCSLNCCQDDPALAGRGRNGRSSCRAGVMGS